MRTLAALACSLALAACDARPPPATARFDVASDDHDAAPFPSDLRRDADGRVHLAALPTRRDASRLFVRLRELLAARDGFCGTCGVSFPIDGALDPASFPGATTGLATDPILLVETTEGSPSRGRLVPLRADWRDDLGMIVLRPARGVVLRGTFTAAITSAIRSSGGAPLAAAPSFDREVHAAPLATLGIDTSAIVAATTFTTEDPLATLREARAAVLAAPAPTIAVDRVWHAGAELDALLGEPAEDRPGIDVAPRAGTAGTRAIAHASVAMVIAGRFTAPRVLTGSGSEVGELRRDATGAIEAGALEEVPFLLTIPVAAELADLPVVVHHHGFNASRVSGLAIADTAARAGVAVLSIDGYQHGARAASARDELHEIRGEGVPGPDGLAETTLLDVSARTFGLGGVPRGEEIFPGYPLGAFVQLAMDVVSALRVIRASDLAPLQAADPALASLALDRDRIRYLGNSMGAVIGTSVLAIEPELAGAILNVPPGSIVENLVESPEFRPLMDAAILPRLGVDPSVFDETSRHLALDPIVDLFRWALEPVDPLALAPELRGRDVLFQVASLDEVASPPATRSYLAVIEPDQVTTHDPAGHGMLEVLDQVSEYEPPHEPPLRPRAAPLPVTNPIAEVHAEIEAYLAR